MITECVGKEEENESKKRQKIFTCPQNGHFPCQLAAERTADPSSWQAVPANEQHCYSIIFTRFG